MVRTWQLLPRDVRLRCIGKIVGWFKDFVVSRCSQDLPVGHVCLGFMLIFLSVDRDLLGHWVVLGELLDPSEWLVRVFATREGAICRYYDVYACLISKGPHAIDKKSRILQLKFQNRMARCTRIVCETCLDPDVKRSCLERHYMAMSRTRQNNMNGMIVCTPMNEHKLTLKTNRQSIRVCMWCLKPNGHGVSLKRCGDCRAVYYCSKNCQTQGWENGHHKLCCASKEFRERCSHVIGW